MNIKIVTKWQQKPPKKTLYKMLTVPLSYEWGPPKLNKWKKYKGILLQKSERTASKLIITERITFGREKDSMTPGISKIDPSFIEKIGQKFSARK